MALCLVDALASRQCPQETAMTEPFGQSIEIGGRSTRDWTRARDRRSPFSNFLAYVAGGLSSAADTAALRVRLEHGLREFVPARSVQIRNASEGPAKPGPLPLARWSSWMCLRANRRARRTSRWLSTRRAASMIGIFSSCSPRPTSRRSFSRSSVLAVVA